MKQIVPTTPQNLYSMDMVAREREANTLLYTTKLVVMGMVSTGRGEADNPCTPENLQCWIYGVKGKGGK